MATNESAYDHTSKGGIYPLNNPIDKGYGVRDPELKNVTANGRFTNQANEKLDFWIEEIEANFGMTGSKAQSRGVREFMPHNINQPTITVTGRAANSFQYNRMASFVRASHYDALNLEELGTTVRTMLVGNKEEGFAETRVKADTVRFVLRKQPEGSPQPWSGRHVKGSHVPWVLEGYIKSFKAGAERFEVAPQFTFEFSVASSELSETGGGKEIGIWSDTQILGNEIKPWLSWITKGKNNFVTVHDENSSKKVEGEKENANEGEIYGPPAPTTFDPPVSLEEEFGIEIPEQLRIK
jgi:hypothetical protein